MANIKYMQTTVTESSIPTAKLMFKGKCLDKESGGLVCKKDHSHDREIVDNSCDPCRAPMHKLSRALRLAWKYSGMAKWTLWDQSKISVEIYNRIKKLSKPDLCHHFCPCGKKKKCPSQYSKSMLHKFSKQRMLKGAWPGCDCFLIYYKNGGLIQLRLEIFQRRLVSCSVTEKGRSITGLTCANLPIYCQPLSMQLLMNSSWWGDTLCSGQGDTHRGDPFQNQLRSLILDSRTIISSVQKLREAAWDNNSWNLKLNRYFLDRFMLMTVSLVVISFVRIAFIRVYKNCGQMMWVSSWKSQVIQFISYLLLSNVIDLDLLRFFHTPRT